MDYLDFEVAIDQGSAGNYRVAALSSPAGQT